MSTNFPSSLDSYATLVDNTDNIVAAHPNDRGDAIEALEAKVGIDSSAVATSHDYLLTHLPAQSQNWDAGAVEVKAQTLESDVATGTAPMTIASTTAVTNLNADMVDGTHLAGLQTILTDSAGLAAALDDETGSGLAVFNDSPTLVTPVLGAATATSINGLTIDTTTGTLDVTNGKTLTVTDDATISATPYTPGGTDVAVADGGTGCSTAATAINALLPSQTGNAGKFLQTDGTDPSWQSGVMVGIQALTSGTTYTPTTGTNSIILMIIGAGGGGGSGIGGNNLSGYGGGGGSGGFALKRFTSISGTYSYAIGAGGAGGQSGLAGSSGGNTTFTGPGSVTVTAYGGNGGTQMSAGTTITFVAGGVGGVISTNGDVNVRGAEGHFGLRLADEKGRSGRGGNSYFAGGGDSKSGSSAGVDGGYGAGGSGGSGEDNANYNGGDGGSGLIVVWEFA